MASIETITFYSDGDQVVGTVFVPDNPRSGGRSPGIVLASGCLGDRHGLFGPAEDLAAEGYIALTFDYRGGVGESTFRGKTNGPDHAHTAFPEVCVRDTRSAITYLQSREDVEPGRIGLFGQSAGGSYVISAAAAEPSVACVVSESGIGDGYRAARMSRNPWVFRKYLERIRQDRTKRIATGKSDLIPLSGTVDGKEGLFILSPEEAASWAKVPQWLPKMRWLDTMVTLELCEAWLEYKPELVADKIAPRPVLFLCTETSVLVPPEEVPSMYEKAGETKKLIVFPASALPSRYAKLRWDQGGRYSPTVWGPAIGWFKQYLPTC